MDKLDLAYAAGFFDGEGSVGVYWYKSVQRFRCVLAVSNTDLNIIEWFRQHWGGSTIKHKSARQHKQCYLWSCNSRPKMAEFLHDVLPYLREKRPQAELALRYFETTCAPGQRMTDEVRAHRHDIVARMKELKHATA